MKRIVYQPRISEKTLRLAATGWYTFDVDRFARKEEIAKKLAFLYGVTVINVRTARMHGKVRRVGKTRQSQKATDWKKALVHLAKGQKIDAFEVTGEGEKK